MNNRQQNKIRLAKKKQEQRIIAISKWNTCCSSSLVDWSCDCLYGCGCCDSHKQCAICGTIYSDKSIQRVIEWTRIYGR